MPTNGKRWVLLLSTLIFIILLIIVIFLLDNQNGKDSNPQLKGYNQIKTESEKLTTKIESDNYKKFIGRLIQLSNPDLTKEQQYNILLNAQPELVFSYYDTNDHSLYILQEEFFSFLRENFPDRVTSKPRIPICYDQVCTDHPQPQEVTDIINKIRASDVSVAVKDDDIKNFINLSLINDTHTQSKIDGFWTKANDILNSEEYKEVGLNEELYNDILAYLKKYYPEDYGRIERQINVEQRLRR